jgi:hypothetical protein
VLVLRKRKSREGLHGFFGLAVLGAAIPNKTESKQTIWKM